MAGDPYRRAQPGERLRIPATAWNRVLDAVNPSGLAYPTNEYRGRWPGQNDCLAKNDTAETVERFGVMSITGIVIDPSDGEHELSSFGDVPCLVGGMPASGSYNKSRWMVAAEPIKAGKIGRVIVAGVAQVKINMQEESHFTADTTGGSRVLLSGGGGSQILWVEPGTGERWALVRIGRSGDLLRLCKTDAAFPKGTSAELNIYEEGEPLAESETAGIHITAYNKYANIAADKFLSVARHGNGRWYVVAAECS